MTHLELLQRKKAAIEAYVQVTMKEADKENVPTAMRSAIEGIVRITYSDAFDRGFEEASHT